MESLGWSIGEQAPDVFLKLFDCQILPMKYAAKLWGVVAHLKPIETVDTAAESSDKFVKCFSFHLRLIDITGKVKNTFKS